MGIKTPMVNWPNCDIEIKLSYKIKLDSIMVEELLVLNVEWCFVFFSDFIKKTRLVGARPPPQHSVVGRRPPYTGREKFRTPASPVHSGTTTHVKWDRP